MIEIKENSNICDVVEGVILQGVNCQGVMGSGVAKQLRDKYPNIFIPYAALCKKYWHDSENLLGRVVTYYPDFRNKEFYIANCFTQEFYGKDGKKYASYDALESCLETVKGTKLPIHIPYLIGAGLGGLNEQVVLAIIEQTLSNNTVYLHKFKP